MIVGVILTVTVTLTTPDILLYPGFVGINVQFCEAVPTVVGAVLVTVKANEPGTEATPPLRVEDAKVCPIMIDVAVGDVVIVGVALFTVTSTVPVTLLYRSVSIAVNVQFCVETPESGTVVEVVKAKLPSTEATPPLSAEFAKF